MRHRKSQQIVSRYQERGREFPAIQAGNSMQEPIKEAEFSEEAASEFAPEPTPEPIETSARHAHTEPEADAANLETKLKLSKITGLEENEPEFKNASNMNLENENKSASSRPHNSDIIGLPPKNKEAENLNSHVTKGPEFSLPEDLRELLEVIRHCGNRITQRELRKKSPYSESKVSLMLSDLEERGLIEKFKRGRGNIIRIPDKHARRQKEPENKNE